MPTPSDPAVRNISDTALWAAAFRALETARPDAVFHDPLAQRLAGDRGVRAAAEMPSGHKHAWAWTTRTWIFDQLIMSHIAAGADAIVNLAAGLDARPYRMEIPSSLHWYEVDMPALIEYKNEVLRDERPRCRLERIPLDLSDVAGRRSVLERIGRQARNALVVTEGLIIYLEADAVTALARDLAAIAGFRAWVTDLVSPGLLRILQKGIGSALSNADAPLKFGPTEGPLFFEPTGWRATQVLSTLRAARRLRRGPLFVRLMSYLPESHGRQGGRPWSAGVLFERAV